MPDTEREILALRYRPHPGQVAVHASAARFRFVCCGRRWGKTRLAAAELLNRAGGEAAGGMRYKAVAAAVRNLHVRLPHDRRLRAAWKKVRDVVNT